MITISLCMIVRDEEEVLSRCLDSVGKIADEIIIVDTGSTDRTVEIARRYTEKVYFFPWQDDFSAARNFSFEKAGGDYCMWLDADDMIEDKDREKFLRLKETLSPDTDMVMMPYHTAFDQRGEPVFVFYRERLLRRKAGFRWQGFLHEAITPSGKIGYSDAAVSHRKLHVKDPERNLRIYEAHLAKGTPFSPRDWFYYGRELADRGQYEKAERVLQDFLDSDRGWVENCREACRYLYQCRKELGKKQEAFRGLLAGLSLGAPDGELCCLLGDWFLEEKNWETAAFWYETALTRKPDASSGGFVRTEYSGYIPALQLGLCRYYQGKVEEACRCNELAETFRPGDLICRKNRAFYRSLGLPVSENRETDL